MNITRSSRRLSGLDAARTLAILGMFAAHTLSLSATDGTNGIVPTFTGTIPSGRASVLFMVLAGISFSLMTRSLIRRGLDKLQTFSIFFRRALLIALCGMLLGPMNEYVANILVHYGLLFLLLTFAVTLPSRALWPIAVGWLIVMPILWRPLALRFRDDTLGHNPSFADLASPVLLFKDLTVSGYYPLIIWIGYGLLGLALGRLDLSRTSNQLRIAAGGLLIAATSLGIGWWQTLRVLPEIRLATSAEAQEASTLLVIGNLPGISLDSFLYTPTYLWLPSAHSNSLVFTIHAAACAVAILGLMLLLTDRLGWLGKVLAGAGRAPLTLYAAHLLVLPMSQLIFSDEISWWILCSGVIAMGIWLAHSPTKTAPLEAGIRYLSGASKEKP